MTLQNISTESTFPCTLIAPDGTEADVLINIEVTAEIIEHIDYVPAPFGEGNVPMPSWEYNNIRWTATIGSQSLRALVKKGWTFEIDSLGVYVTTIEKMDDLANKMLENAQ